MKSALGVLAVLLVVACGSAVSSAGGGSLTSSSPKRATVSGVPSSQTARDQLGQTGPASTDPAKPSDIVPPVGQGPRVIRNAQIEVEVRNGSFDSTLNQLFSIASGLGGYISGSNANANADGGSLRSGTITFQVPTDKFETAIQDVYGLGKVQNFTVGGQDVSQQYVDLTARLRNAEAQRDAMLALLGQAKTVNEIIAVQNQIGAITAQIEQLKGQINYFDHATSFSTISVSVHEAAVLLRPATDSWGFTTALSQALHGFVNTLDFILVGIGQAGPVLVLLALGLLAWRLRRRLAL